MKGAWLKSYYYIAERKWGMISNWNGYISFVSLPLHWREEYLFYNSSDNSVQLIDLFSIKEVAAYLKVSQRLVRRMIASGELEAMKVGREWRVPIDAIAAWVDNNREWKWSVIRCTNSKPSILARQYPGW